MSEKATRYVIKEATRKRCKIVPVEGALMSKFRPVSLELFSYLKEAKKIDFSLYFRCEEELIEFIRPEELSEVLIEQMWAASLKPSDKVEICLLKTDYPKFESLITKIRNQKLAAVLEKDETLDQKVLKVYASLSSASQMILRGGISAEVVKKAAQSTAQLMTAQIDSEIALGTLSRMVRCDETLYDHSAAVAMFSAIIASSFLKNPLPKNEAEIVAQCGLYHDAGKSCIPNHILNKPGLFTPDEFEIMKNHTIHGQAELNAVIAQGAPLHPLTALVAIEHHERFTGKGYPSKKRGRLEEGSHGIHLYTRIVSIADVYSALLMKRVYKESLNSESAINFMSKIADDDFDPEIFQPFYQHVKASIELFRKREENLKKDVGVVKMIDKNASFSKAVMDNQSLRAGKKR